MKQVKVTARDIPEGDISDMPDGKFKATTIKMLCGVEKSMEVIRGTTVAEIKEVKKKTYRTEMKNATTMV